MPVKFLQTVRLGDRIFRTNRPKGAFAVVGEQVTGGKRLLHVRRGSVGYMVFSHMVEPIGRRKQANG